MREYETVCVLSAKASEAEIKEIETRVQKTIADHKGQLFLKRFLGKKPLSYRMKKEREGAYLHFDFAGPGPVVSEIEKILRYDERVLRFMTLQLQEKVDWAKRAKELEAA